MRNRCSSSPESGIGLGAVMQAIGIALMIALTALMAVLGSRAWLLLTGGLG